MMSFRDDIAILVDHDTGAGEGRGIIFAPALGITANTVNEMARSGRGLITCCIGMRRAFELGLRSMQGNVRRPGMPHYLVSVEAAACADTGISAADRALTLRVLGDPASTPADLCSPGHIMPCLPPDEGESQSIVALAFEHVALHTRMPALAWCDILDEQGEVAAAEHCLELGRRLGCTLFDTRSIRDFEDITPKSHSSARPTGTISRGWLAAFDQQMHDDLLLPLAR